MLLLLLLFFPFQSVFLDQEHRSGRDSSGSGGQIMVWPGFLGAVGKL